MYLKSQFRIILEIQLHKYGKIYNQMTLISGDEVMTTLFEKEIKEEHTYQQRANLHLSPLLPQEGGKLEGKLCQMATLFKQISSIT